MEATSAESYECKRQTEYISNSRCTYDDLTSTFKPREISRDQPLRFGFRGSACAISSQQTGIGSERRALMNSSEYSYHGYCACACAFFCVCALNSSPPPTQPKAGVGNPFPTHTLPPTPPPWPKVGSSWELASDARMLLKQMLQYLSAALMRHRDDYYWGPGGPGPRSGVGNPFPTPPYPPWPKVRCRESIPHTPPTLPWPKLRCRESKIQMPRERVYR